MLIKIGERFVNPAHVLLIEMVSSSRFAIRLIESDGDIMVYGTVTEMTATADRINAAIQFAAGK